MNAITLFAAMFAAMVFAWPTHASAQVAAPAPDRHFVSASDWWTLGVFALGTAVVAPFDSRLAHQIGRSPLHQNHSVDQSAEAFRALGDPGTLLLSAGAFAVGRLTHKATLADAGLHATEAVLLGGAVTGVLKELVGRARPYIVGADSAYVFLPLSGTPGYTSFPSGHTTAAFAAASAVAAEVARSQYAMRHPRAARAVAPVLFASATLVGVSRMYHDAHWASDVVAGAGIGTVAGHIVVRLQHNGPRGRVDRWLLPSQIVPVSGGAAAVWNFTFR